MPYQSRRPQVRATLRHAQDAGLRAAVQVPVNATKRGLMGGYTSGDFVTGNVINSVTVAPIVDVPGGRGISYGTNVEYALYWELGFIPARGVFSPGMGPNTAGPIAMQRKEVWRPALFDSADATRAAYARGFARAWGGGPSAALDVAGD